MWQILKLAVKLQYTSLPHLPFNLTPLQLPLLLIEVGRQLGRQMSVGTRVDYQNFCLLFTAKVSWNPSRNFDCTQFALPLYSKINWPSYCENFKNKTNCMLDAITSSNAVVFDEMIHTDGQKHLKILSSTLWKSRAIRTQYAGTRSLQTKSGHKFAKYRSFWDRDEAWDIFQVSNWPIKFFKTFLFAEIDFVVLSGSAICWIVDSFPK